MRRDEPQITKEAWHHAQHDTRNLREGRSVQETVIRHAQADMDHPTIEAAATEPPKERGFFGRVADRVAQAWSELRIGDEHAMGMAKLGAHELTQSLAAFPDSNVRPMKEPGVFGNEHMPHIQHQDHESRSQDNDRSRDR